MDKFALYHFAIKKNERIFKLDLQPGTPWTELFEVLEEFKAEFEKMKAEEEIKAEEQKSKE